MITPLNTIISLLPKLSTAELKTLQDRIKALQQFNGHSHDEESSSSSPEAQALDAVHEVLKGIGVELTQPPLLRKRANMPAFREDLKSVMAFLENNGAPLTRIERQTLLNFGVELLYKNMTEMGVPISGTTVIRHFHRIPAVFNAAFPGYASAGLLRMIIRK